MINQQANKLIAQPRRIGCQSREVQGHYSWQSEVLVWKSGLLVQANGMLIQASELVVQVSRRLGCQSRQMSFQPRRVCSQARTLIHMPLLAHKSRMLDNESPVSPHHSLYHWITAVSKQLLSDSHTYFWHESCTIGKGCLGLNNKSLVVIYWLIKACCRVQKIPRSLKAAVVFSGPTQPVFLSCCNLCSLQHATWSKTSKMMTFKMN